MGKYTTVLAQEYHRNGSRGDGFIVSLVRWPDAAEEAGNDLFLAVTYPKYNDEGEQEQGRIHRRDPAHQPRPRHLGRYRRGRCDAQRMARGGPRRFCRRHRVA